MTPRADVLVVGAGPAGAAAAVAARARGLDVLVVDKAGFPRDKTCGDGLTASALRLLERIGIDVPALPGYAAVRETVLVSPSGREVALPLPEVGEHSAVVPRVELDDALVRRVRELGIDVREQVALTELHHDTDGVQARFADGTSIGVKFVIAADGHWSSVRRLTGTRSPGLGQADLGTWHAFRQYFCEVEDPRQWVLFERDLLPGYAWVFPLSGGRANVGFGVLRGAQSRSGKELAALWRNLLDRPRMRAVLGPQAQPEGSQRAWPIPATYDRARLTDGRRLYVGDAAGVVDPMTGEGIAQALATGIFAADAIARGITRGHDVAVIAERYTKVVDRALGRDLRFATTLQRVLRSSIGTRAAIRTAGLSAWTRRNFARWMFEDYPRAVVLTPDRWRRGMFTPPGAYRAA